MVAGELTGRTDNTLNGSFDHLHVITVALLYQSGSSAFLFVLVVDLYQHATPIVCGPTIQLHWVYHGGPRCECMRCFLMA